MTPLILLQVILFGIALSMDAFAVSVTDGLVYLDINKKKSFYIAGMFGFMQGLMPLIGYFFIELATVIVHSFVGDSASIEIIKNTELIFGWVVTGISFALLMFLGIKMLVEGIRDVKERSKFKCLKHFSYGEVFLMGIATSIDAMAVGVSLHSGISDNVTIFLHISIIAIITFGLSLIGVFLGDKIEKLLKGKYQACTIIGGVILICVGAWILISHIVGI